MIAMEVPGFQFQGEGGTSKSDFHASIIGSCLGRQILGTANFDSLNTYDDQFMHQLGYCIPGFQA